VVEQILPDYLEHGRYLDQIKKGEITLEAVPEEFVDKSMWKAAVMASKKPRLQNVPEEFIDREMAAYAVREHADNFYYTPEEFIDHEFCKNLKRHGNGIKYVPKKYKDYDMYLYFCENNPEFIKEVPEEFRDQKMWRTAILSYWGYRIYEKMPRKYIDSEFARKLSRYNIYAIGRIEDLNYDDCYNAVKKPEHLKLYSIQPFLDKKMCLKVMKGKMVDINCVPKDLLDEEICLLIYNNGDCNDYALGNIPDEYITYDMCLRDVKMHGSLLKKVPKRFKTLEICYLALNDNLSYLEYFPDEYKTRELCLDVVEKDPGCYQYIPDEYKTPEMSHRAISECLYNAKYAPKDHFTHEIAEIIAKKRARYLQYVPDHLKTYDLLKKGDYDTIRYVPEEILDKEICDKYVRMSKENFKFIPDKFKHYKMCMRVCRMDNDYVIYVPDHLKEEVRERCRYM
jgi:hypothetical protein